MSYRKSAHSVYDLKYHIVFCTKYRYRVLGGEVATRSRDLIREICAANYIDIISGSISPDYVHLLISIPPHMSVSKAVQYIKSKKQSRVVVRICATKEEILGTTHVVQGIFFGDDRLYQRARRAKIYRRAGSS